MADTSKTELSPREIFYYRRRYQNRFFSRLAAFFVEEAQRSGMTKKQIAARLGRDPSFITRLLAHPSNLTLDTVSDFMLALGAEADAPVFRRFIDGNPVW